MTGTRRGESRSVFHENPVKISRMGGEARWGEANGRAGGLGAGGCGSMPGSTR
jgi:hypothetical protein